MINSDYKLPSNKKFGLIFSIIFTIISLYFIFQNKYFVSYIILIISLVFFLASVFQDNLLLPLNKIWFRLGIILGSVISPIILGLIFFLLFTPIGLTMRIFRRDDLNLNIFHKNSYWIKRDRNKNKIDEYKYQI